ncbi:MAG: SDR family oxidoreductase [Betaproteobacteria bacterium]|nr:SDR family oxidoreductase [Betaproteobacteria bacterium]
MTGASSGIGASLARHYAASGATLGLIARRKPELERLAAGFPTPCEVYALDVRDATAIAAAARHFIARHGCPDIVIANAGVSLGTLTEHAEDIPAFQEVFDINVMGMVKAFQPFVACMRERGGGALAGIASIAGYRGLPGAAAYSASKAAVISCLESLRVELRASGVKVTAICPGYIATPMTEKNPYPMPFLMSADEAAVKIAALIEHGRTFAVIPWQMALAARVMRVLPNWLYDRLAADAPRKPRRAAE